MNAAYAIFAAGFIGACTIKPDALSKAAAILGASKSKKKAAASRRNGCKGGRPKIKKP